MIQGMKKITAALFCAMLIAGLMTFAGFSVYAQQVGDEAALKAAAAAGGEVVMSGDIRLGSCLKVEKDLTLDLNGNALYRTLSEAAGDGHVIEVAKSGKLTLTDSSAGGKGTVSGGCAEYGGGIFNAGTLFITGGTISGNVASRNGGGIVAAAGSETTITNALIMKNDAKNGGGISIEVGAKVFNITNTTIRNNTALYDGGGILDLGGVVLEDCVIVNNNAYDTGSGVYVNYNNFSVKGANIIKKNPGSNVFLRNDRKIDVVGKLDIKSEIGVSGDNANRTFTNGYSDYNSEEPGNYFFSDLDSGSVSFSGDKLEAVSSAGYSVVEVFDSNNTVTKSERYLDPETAWDKAVSYAGETGKVVCRLGANWSHDRLLSVSGNKKLTLDLNGFYILRTRAGETTENGNVFTIEDGASFTIIDTRPKSKGYDGFKGGVIAGGCNDSDGGGIIVGEDASLFIDGGTLVNCYADGDGGGIYIDADADKVDIRNFTVTSCTADSIKADGGGIYNCNNDFSMTDSTISGCFSNDNGGGACIDSSGSGSGNVTFKNVIFSNNIAEDYAGALSLWSFDGDGDYLLFDSCNFYSNSSNTTDGGAVYIDDTDEVFTLFKNCNFMYNESGADGGAMTVYEDNVALASCLFAQNKAVDNGGAVFVDSGYSINLKGLMVIKDNISEHDRNQKDLFLNSSMSSRAKVYSGGLYEGSYISFNASGEFAENIAEYQKKYFHPISGNMDFVKTDTVQTAVISTESNETASMFGTGSVIVITIIAFAVLAVAGAAIVFKKKKGEDHRANDEDE